MPLVNPVVATISAYYCANGVVVLNKTGGDSSPVEYSASGVTGWSTSSMFLIPNALRNSALPIVFRVRQNGVEGTAAVLSIQSFCGAPAPANVAPTVVRQPASQTLTGGFPYALPVYPIFTDVETPNNLTFGMLGLPPGLGLSGGSITGVLSVTGVFPIYLTATDPQGLSIHTGYVLTVTNQPVAPPDPNCASPANTLGSPLQIVGVKDINCQNGTFRVVVAGGNGTGINYAPITGLSNADPANCLRVLESAALIGAVNNPLGGGAPLQIKVTQNGRTSNTFSFNFKQYCTGSARVVSEQSETDNDLQVTVLGNPIVGEWVDLLVQNTHGEPLRFTVYDAQSRMVNELQAESMDQEVVHRRLRLGPVGGLYLIRVETPTRHKTSRIVKQ